MRKCDVRTPEDALAYLTDCQLASVSLMAMKKRRPKYAYERQISIAQTGLDWMNVFGSLIKRHDRAFLAQKVGVAQWAKQFEPTE